jgi:hypothetical protein
MGAAEKTATYLYTMAYHSAFAMFANRRNRLNCTLEAVERVRCTRSDKFEGLVVFVAADFALCHFATSLRSD